MPEKQDLLTTAAGGVTALGFLASVRWEQIPHGELVKIGVAFGLLVVGYLMYRGKR